MMSEQRQKELNYISFLSKSFGCKFSREQNYLIMFAKDLRHNSECIKALGIMKADDVTKTSFKDSAKQNYFDFVCTFESLCEKIKLFRWDAKILADYGINFSEYQKLYIAVS